jgi:integrase
MTDPKKPKKYAARCRYRDGDGTTRLVERHGHSRTAALKNLQDALEHRHAPKVQGLGPQARFREAAAIWLDGKERKRSATRAKAYRTRLALILPELGELRLREISVARLETFFDDLEDRGLSANYRRSLRAAVSGTFQVAVKHRAIGFNPVSALDDIEGGRKQPRGLTAEERRRLLDFLDNDVAARRRDLPDLARFMLGTGVRIGEALAVRWCDLQLDGIPVLVEGNKVMVPVVAVTHTITRPPGKTLQRTTVKTEAGKRLLPLPAFVVAMLRARRTEIFADEDPVFPAAGRSGLTWREPSEVGRWIKEAREDDAVQLEWMTSHSWRKTYLTVLDDEREMTDRAKADLAGQSRFLKDIYVNRGALHPEAAAFIDAALPDL